MRKDEKFYKLIRLWVTRRLTNSDFIEMAEWIERRTDAMHLVFHQVTERDYNRTLAMAFLAASRASKGQRT